MMDTGYSCFCVKHQWLHLCMDRLECGRNDWNMNYFYVIRNIGAFTPLLMAVSCSESTFLGTVC